MSARACEGARACAVSQKHDGGAARLRRRPRREGERLQLGVARLELKGLVGHLAQDLTGWAVGVGASKRAEVSGPLGRAARAASVCARSAGGRGRAKRACSPSSLTHTHTPIHTPGRGRGRRRAAPPPPPPHALSGAQAPHTPPASHTTEVRTWSRSRSTAGGASAGALRSTRRMRPLPSIDPMTWGARGRGGFVPPRARACFRRARSAECGCRRGLVEEGGCTQRAPGGSENCSLFFARSAAGGGLAQTWVCIISAAGRA